jgi:hypothetical protein
MLALFIGEDVRTTMYSFLLDTEVDEYERILDDGEIAEMASFHKIDPSDLESLIECVPDYYFGTGFIRDGRLGYTSTSNPQGKFEWFEIGGQFKNTLELKTPRKSFWWFLGMGPVTHVTSARLGELDRDALHNEDPAWLIVNRECHTNPSVGSSAWGEVFANELRAWKLFYHHTLDSLPPETRVTAIDAHT